MKRSIVFYDSSCPLCSRVVRFILRHERSKILYFSPLQGGYARSFLPSQGVNEVDLSTFYLYSNGRVYSRSSAGLRLLVFLKWYLFFFHIFWVFPPFIRDFMYNIIAKNRYKLFKEKCEIGKVDQERFLESRD